MSAVSPSHTHRQIDMNNKELIEGKVYLMCLLVNGEPAHRVMIRAYKPVLEMFGRILWDSHTIWSKDTIIWLASTDTFEEISDEEVTVYLLAD